MTARMHLALMAIGGLLLAAALPTAAYAQAPDSRWGPWIGCWALVQQPLRADPREGAVEDDATPEVSNDAQVCVEQAGDGVVLRTLVDGAPVLEQTMVADGTARAIDRDGCRGTERAWWSSNGLRLFSEARLTCSGSERTVSGMAFIGADGRWVDVQSVQVGSADTVRVRHFEPDIRKAAIPNVAAAALTIEDVVEASEQVAPSTIEAAILESRSRFPISSRVLVELSDAGVPGSVTDLMVAVTFPDRFLVARVQPDDRVAYFDPYPYGISRWSWAAYNPYFYSPYYYSPFGYDYLAWYPSVAVTGGVGGGGGGGSVATDDGAPAFGSGRVVNGQGYTRVQSLTGAEAAARQGGGGGGGGSVSPQGFSSGGSTSSGGSSSSSGSSSSGGSSSGGGTSSPSGSSGGGGRTAVPR